MTETWVTRLTTDDEWDEAVPVLQQLWTDHDESFVRSFRDEEGYHLLGRYADGTLVAVAGVSIQRVLHHVRHAWIHDFVVDEDNRRAGHGEALLSHVESWARERDCEYVALALRDGNDAGREFYETLDVEQWGAVMEKEL